MPRLSVRGCHRSQKAVHRQNPFIRSPCHRIAPTTAVTAVGTGGNAARSRFLCAHATKQCKKLHTYIHRRDGTTADIIHNADRARECEKDDSVCVLLSVNDDNFKLTDVARVNLTAKCELINYQRSELLEDCHNKKEGVSPQTVFWESGVCA